MKEQLGLSVINETLNESQINAADLLSNQTFKKDVDDSAEKIRAFMQTTENFFNRGNKPLASIIVKRDDKQVVPPPAASQ